MTMHSPCHTGELVLHNCIEPLGLTVSDAAKGLGVSRVQLSRVLNGNSAVSAEMAIRLAKAFGSTPEHWLRLQMAYDLAKAQKRSSKIKVKPLPRA